MQLELKQSPEKVQRRHSDFIAIPNSRVHVHLSLLNLPLLPLTIYSLSSHGVRVRPNCRYYVEAIGVLVEWELETPFVEVLGSHQVVLVVHLQDALAQQLIVDRRQVQFAQLLGALDVLEG